MAQVIGIIKLAPGEVGFYDEVSRIHLTISRPSAEVYDYMNTTKLIKAVRSKVLILVAGSLNAARIASETQAFTEVKKVNTIIPKEIESIEKQPEIVVISEKINETEVTPITEEIIVEEINEVEEVEQPKKRTTAKKK